MLKIRQMIRQAHADAGKEVGKRTHTGVGTAVRGNLVVNSRYYPIFGNACLDGNPHGMAPQIGSERVELCGHNLYRPARLLGQHNGRKITIRHVVLGATEVAADKGRYDPHITQGQIKTVGKNSVGEIGASLCPLEDYTIRVRPVGKRCRRLNIPLGHAGGLERVLPNKV